MSAEFRIAYLLHRRPYRNTSLLVECLVEGAGRFPLIARGGAKGRLQGVLQPFQPLMLSWSGNGEVKTLQKAEPASPLAGQLKGNFLYCGFYLNELLMNLVPRHDAHDEVLQIYHQALESLIDRLPPDCVLRQFELQLLEVLGYAVPLDCTSDGSPVEKGKRYYYDLELGLSEGSAELSGESGSSISGEALIALGEGRCEEEYLRTEARNLMRRIIDHQLDHKPLKSRELFR